MYYVYKVNRRIYMRRHLLVAQITSIKSLPIFTYHKRIQLVIHTTSEQQHICDRRREWIHIFNVTRNQSIQDIKETVTAYRRLLI